MTSVPVSASPAGPVMACPLWCAPHWCRSSDRDRHHRASPVGLDLAETRWTSQLHRADDYAFPAEPGCPELEVVISDLFGEAPDLGFSLPVEDVPDVVEHLLARYYQARFHGGPAATTTVRAVGDGVRRVA